MHISILGDHVEWSLGANLLDQVNLLRVDKGLVLISIILLSNGDVGQRRSFLTQICHNGASINSRDGWYSFTGTLLTEALNSSLIAVLLSIVSDNNTTTLNV
jgi:uncharacterized membrane protein YbjE (DUF340 family)